MTLVEQFEKHRNEMRPCEPCSESEKPEQWAAVLAWQTGYSEWLEAKLQNTSSNCDYAKCPACGNNAKAFPEPTIYRCGNPDCQWAGNFA